MSRRSVAALRGSNSPARMQLLNQIRRESVDVTKDQGIWSTRAYIDDDGNVETNPDVEVFQGVGFASRPLKANEAECIVARVGAKGNNPVIIATRDRDAEIALNRDETAIFNSTGTFAKIKADGSIELNNGTVTLTVDGANVNVGGSTDFIVKGNTYRTAEDVMLAALAAARSARDLRSPLSVSCNTTSGS